MAEDLQDIRVQARLRRALEIRLGQAVMEAIAGGLNGDNALQATKVIYENEVACERSRRIAARSY
jgi:hypothetical protein